MASSFNINGAVHRCILGFGNHDWRDCRDGWGISQGDEHQKERKKVGGRYGHAAKQRRHGGIEIKED